MGVFKITEKDKPETGQSTYLSSKITGRVFQSPSISRHSAGSGGMLVRYSEFRMSRDSWLWVWILGREGVQKVINQTGLEVFSSLTPQKSINNDVSRCR